MINLYPSLLLALERIPMAFVALLLADRFTIFKLHLMSQCHWPTACECTVNRYNNFDVSDKMELKHYLEKEKVSFYRNKQ